jgi:hypothetical protein
MQKEQKKNEIQEGSWLPGFTFHPNIIFVFYSYTDFFISGVRTRNALINNSHTINESTTKGHARHLSFQRPLSPLGANSERQSIA